MEIHTCENFKGNYGACGWVPAETWARGASTDHCWWATRNALEPHQHWLECQFISAGLSVIQWQSIHGRMWHVTLCHLADLMAVQSLLQYVAEHSQSWSLESLEISIQRCPPQRMDQTCPPMFNSTWLISQTGEMQVCHWWSFDMIVKSSQLAMNLIKLDRIFNWPTSLKVMDIYSFLSFANFYHCFIPDYSNIVHPLINFIKKKFQWNWTPACQTSFDNLTSLFLLKPILYLPVLFASFAVTTDASKHISGALLLQTAFNGAWHSCFYLFQLFFPTEQNYNIYDWEFLAIIYTMKSCRHYLYRSPFPVQVFTDHKNLIYICQPQALNCQQACWLLDLSNFDLKIIHVPGKLLAIPNALSCCPDILPTSHLYNEDVTLLPPFLFICISDTSLSDCVQSASTDDPLILQTLQSMSTMNNLQGLHWGGQTNFHHMMGSDG